MQYKVNPNIYDKEYFLDKSYAGADQYKGGLRKLAPAIDRIYKQVGFSAGGRKFLDAGCGKGELLYFMAKKGYEVYGIDYSITAVEMSRELLKNKQIKGGVFKGDVRKTPFPDNCFDLIISTDVIEHLDDNSAVIDFLNEMRRVLKPSGKIYLHTSPNRIYVDYFKKYYLRYINAIIFTFLKLFNNDKNKKPKDFLELRSYYEKLMHVNEQTYFSLKENLKMSKFKKYRVNIFSDPLAFNLLKLPYYLVGHLFPLNRLFPLSIFLGSHLYACAEK